jgi:hypothetical protein
LVVYLCQTTEIMTKHPRLFSLAVGFAITLAVGTAIGMTYHQQAFAQSASSAAAASGSSSSSRY